MARAKSWFRVTWSIRTLLVVTALVSVGTAWQVPRWRREHAIKTLGELGAGLDKKDGKIRELTLPDLNLGFLGALPVGGVDAWKDPEHIVPMIGEVDTLESMWIVPGDLRAINFSSWSKLRQLREIQIDHADLSKANFEVLAALPSLESLRLSCSTFDAEALAPLARCKRLREVALSDGSVVPVDAQRNAKAYRTIDSKRLEALRGMESLERLELYDTDVDDSVIDILLSFPNLQYVNLWNTRVTRVGVTRLLDESKIESLIVDEDLVKELEGDLTESQRARFKEF